MSGRTAHYGRWELGGSGLRKTHLNNHSLMNDVEYNPRPLLCSLVCVVLWILHLVAEHKTTVQKLVVVADDSVAEEKG